MTQLKGCLCVFIKFYLARDNDEKFIPLVDYLSICFSFAFFRCFSASAVAVWGCMPSSLYVPKQQWFGIEANTYNLFFRLDGKHALMVLLFLQIAPRGSYWVRKNIFITCNGTSFDGEKLFDWMEISTERIIFFIPRCDYRERFAEEIERVWPTFSYISGNVFVSCHKWFCCQTKLTDRFVLPLQSVVDRCQLTFNKLDKTNRKLWQKIRTSNISLWKVCSSWKRSRGDAFSNES